MSPGSPSNSFIPQGAHQLLTTLGSAAHLEQQVQAIERAVIELPNLVPDLSRTLIETCCTTILNERGFDCEGLGFKDLLKKRIQRSNLCQIQNYPDQKRRMLYESL